MNVRMQAGGCSSTIPVAGGRDDACSGRHSSVQRCGGIVAAIAAAGLAFAGVPAEALDATLPPPQTVAVDVNDSMIEAAIGKLDGLASDILKRSGIPGLAVAVVWKGETVFAKGYGVRRVGVPDPVDADTVFQLASVSKSISGTIVARQVGEGILRWDDPVAKHLPSFALGDPRLRDMLTIGDLFAHRSGLPDHAGDDLEDLGYDRKAVLDRLQLLPLSAFRAHYAYTNFGLTAAAEAVAVASGSDWASLAEDVLFGPLGMTSASMRYSDFEARANRAALHVRSGYGFVPRYQRKPDAQAPAGGASASVKDLARWMDLVLSGGDFEGKPLIAREALRAATTPQVISAPAYAADARAGFYGYGFNVGTEPSGRVSISHSGGFLLGAGTNYLLVPSLDLGIAVLTNAQPTGVAESLGRMFLDTVEYGAPTRDWLKAYGDLFAPMFEPVGDLAGKSPPVSPQPAQALDAYRGRFDNPYFGPVSVAGTDDRLTLSIGLAPTVYELAHWDGDSFVFDLQGENAPEGSRSEVRFDPAAGSVWIEVFDENGLGTFTRSN